MKKLLLIACLSISINGHSVTMIGGSDCGEWFQQTSAKSWVVGYLSGINAARAREEGDILKEVSAAQIFLWIDNYCKANPLKTVQQGANVLAYELFRKSNK